MVVLSFVGRDLIISIVFLMEKCTFEWKDSSEKNERAVLVMPVVLYRRSQVVGTKEQTKKLYTTKSVLQKMKQLKLDNTKSAVRRCKSGFI